MDVDVLRCTLAFPEPVAGAVCRLTGGGLLPAPLLTPAFGRGDDDVDGRERDPDGCGIGDMLLMLG